MAFNFQTFRVRALSAIFFVIIMVAGILVSHWTFFLLFSVIHFGCWLEYQQLIRKIDPEYASITAFHRYGAMLLGWAFMLFMTNDAYLVTGNFYLYEIGWWLMLILAITLPVVEVLLGKQLNLKNIGYTLLGLVYISLSWGLMISMRVEGMVQLGTLISFDFGWVIPAVLIASIWINDTMAYIVGSLIGKTPLSAISPKKTWEGTIGGIVLAVAAITLLGYYALGMQDYVSVMVIAGIAAVFGTLGDLFESKLKRLAGVKDSGNLMPGHGGFLDRFDSLLFATPLVWLYLWLIS